MINTTYQGSNPEYLITEQNKKFVTFKEFQEKVSPILQKSFPISDIDVPNSIKQIGFRATPIPKTLYDLFVIYFRLKDRMKHDSQYRSNREERREHILPFFIYTEEEQLNDLWKFLKKEKLLSYVPSIKPCIENISEKFIEREQNPFYIESQHYLNNRITKYFNKRKYNLESIKLEEIHLIVNHLFKKLNETKEKFLNVDFSSMDFFHDKYFRGFRNERCQKIIMEAIKHEYQLDPSYYTLYRASNREEDNVTGRRLNPYSISFGLSPLSGIIYDGPTGSVLGYGWSSESKTFAYDINKSEYLNPESLTSRLILIPPARGLNRVAEKGEFGHARSKFYHDGKAKQIDGINNDYGDSTSTAKRMKNNPLLTDMTSFEDVLEFKNTGEKFINSSIKVNLV